MFHLDQLSRLEQNVINKALEDRHRFDKIYGIIEKYISSNKLIVGGTISIKMVTNTPKDQFDYQYLVYTEDPLKHGFEISNLCAERCNATVMRTEIYGKEFTIRIQDRPLVTLIYIGKFMREIIRPLSINDIHYVPPDFHLLQLYRNLYMPLDVWEESLHDEMRLYRWLKSEYGKNQKKFIGSSEDKTDFRKIRVELKSQLLKYLSDRKDIILIGACAYDILTNVESDSNVEILGTEAIANEMTEWIRKRVQLNTTSKKSDIMLISDFRLNRTTIFVSNQTNKIPIMYIYNSLEYDLVPYNKSTHSIYSGQIGNPFVILRYILIDIWIIKVIRAHGGIDEEFAKGKILDSYTRFFNIRDNLKLDKDHIQVKDDDDLWSVFQPAEDSRYIGQYLSDITARKAIIKAQDFIADYLPIKYKKEHGYYQSPKSHPYKKSMKGGGTGLDFLKSMIEKVENNTLNPIYEYNQLETFNCDKTPENYNVIKLGCHHGQRKLLLTEIQFMTRSPNLIIYAGSAPNEHMSILLDMFPDNKFLLIDPNYHTFDRDYKYVYMNWNSISIETINSVKRDISNINNRRYQNVKRLKEASFIDGSSHDVIDFDKSKMDEIKTSVKYSSLIKSLIDGKDRIYIIQDYMTRELANLLSLSLKEADNPEFGFISDIRTNLFDSGPVDLDYVWNDGLQLVFIKTMRPTLSMIKFHPPLRYTDDNSVKDFIDGKLKNDTVKKDLEYIKKYTNMLKNYMDDKHLYFTNSTIYLQAWAPKTSTEARLIITHDDIDKPFINYDYNEWWDRFRYLKYLRGYGYFKHHVYTKHANVGDGCFDCMLETLILSDYLMKNTTLYLNTDVILKWLSDQNNVKSIKNLWQKINKNLLYPVDQKGIHGYIKSPPENIHFYEYQGDSPGTGTVYEIDNKLNKIVAYTFNGKLESVNGYKLNIMRYFKEKDGDLDKLAFNIKKSHV